MRERAGHRCALYFSSPVAPGTFCHGSKRLRARAGKRSEVTNLLVCKIDRIEMKIFIPVFIRKIEQMLAIERPRVIVNSAMCSSRDHARSLGRKVLYENIGHAFVGRRDIRKHLTIRRNPDCRALRIGE